MKIAITILAIVLALLSAAAGAAKLALVPDEVEFLNGFGFSEIGIYFYGGAQIVGGLLMVIPISALVGSTTVLLAFTLSTVLLFLDGNVVFAFVSALPIVLTAFVMFHRYRRIQEAAEGDA